MAYNVPNPVISAAGSEIWAQPLTPDANDIEFNESTLPAAWSRDYTASATAISAIASFAAGDTREDLNGFRPSWLRLQPPGNNTSVGIHRAYTPAGSVPDGLYLARLGFCYRFGSIANNDGNVALQICATSAGVPDVNNRVYVFLNEADANVVAPEAGVVNGGVNTSTSLPDQENTGLHWEYVAIIRNGNSFPLFVGTRQGSWTYITTATYTGVPNLDRIYLSCSNNATNAPGNMIVKFDFFRYFTRQDLP